MGIFKRDYNYNPYFFNKIQPVGGIKFNPRSIVKGDGYEACLRIYDFPTSVDEFWLGKLIDIKDVTVTIDVETEDRSKALQSLNSAISENVDRANSLKNNIDIIEANNATSILMGLVNDITSRLIFSIMTGQGELITTGLTESSEGAVKFIISLVGIMCFWCGVMKDRKSVV